MSNPSVVKCLCPSCDKLFLQNGEVLKTSLAAAEELEFGQAHDFEELEELRRYLKSFMNPEVLQSIVDILSILDQEPKHTEMFSYFCRNSQYGANCRYALTALRKFKEQKAEKLKEKLENALQTLEEL